MDIPQAAVRVLFLLTTDLRDSHGFESVLGTNRRASVEVLFMILSTGVTWCIYVPIHELLHDVGFNRPTTNTSFLPSFALPYNNAHPPGNPIKIIQ